MSECIRPRRICALLLAYVVALQAVLLPLSLAVSAPFNNSLCGARTSDSSQGSGSLDAAYVCAAGCSVSCCAQTLDQPPYVLAVVAREARPSAACSAFASPVKSASRGPQIPRATGLIKLIASQSPPIHAPRLKHARVSHQEQIT